MLHADLLKEIKEHALDVDWNKAFAGKSHGNRHLFRVVEIATFLCEREDAERDICEAGAWLHDLGLQAGNDNNPAVIRQIADQYLSSLALKPDLARRIAECVEAHEGNWDAASLEARIVHDADVLDKMGLLGVIRHTWKIVNLIAPDLDAPQVCALVQSHLRARRERLYTATARQLVRHLNAAQAQFFAQPAQAVEQISLIMQEARQGAISDQIAYTFFSATRNNSLMHQIFINHEILQGWHEHQPLER